MTYSHNPVDHRAFAVWSHRINVDERVPSKTRELMLALLYAITVAPQDVENRWETVRSILCGWGREPHRQLGTFVLDDLPRYEEETIGFRFRCVARRARPFTPRPRLAVDEQTRIELDPWLCNKGGDIGVIERDLQTGRYVRHWYCRKHERHAEVHRVGLEAHNEAAPAPIPNKGGLLPCYFIGDWLTIYQGYARQGWVAPVYGICADDWPGASGVARPRKPKLTIIKGGLV